jgi:hypothetical protein
VAHSFLKPLSMISKAKDRENSGTGKSFLNGRRK